MIATACDEILREITFVCFFDMFQRSLSAHQLGPGEVKQAKAEIKGGFSALQHPDAGPLPFVNTLKCNLKAPVYGPHSPVPVQAII